MQPAVFLFSFEFEKKFLLKKIMEIEEQRHDEVMKMIGNRNNIEDKQL